MPSNAAGVARLVAFDRKTPETVVKTCRDGARREAGSLLFSVVRDGAFVHVAMGTLLDGPSIRPTRHIFVGSKAPWFTITDDLLQFAEHVV